MAPNKGNTRDEINKIDVYGNPFKTIDSVSKSIKYSANKANDIRKLNLADKRSSHKEEEVLQDNNEPKTQIPLYLAIFGYISYTFLFCVSWIRELIYGMGPHRGRNRHRFIENFRAGYAPLYASFESFYVRNVYRRLADVFGNTIASVPGATVKVVERISDDDNWTFELKKNSGGKECINLASYNYLGFAESEGECTDKAIEALHGYGVACCSTNHELGVKEIHTKLEATVSNFLGVEDSIAVGMGFATNTLNLPCLVSKGCLVLSDEFNHASLILGLRLSGATVKVFKHNNTANLEQIIRNAVIKGQPRTNRPWRKILIVVEGIYSMEGSICRLPQIISIKKKYKAYLYLDEAHSVGAMGRNGRGIVDYFGLDPKDVDLMMGTFTKSFGAAGGYIAGSKSLINYLRVYSQAKCYCSTISPPIANQIISSMECIINKELGGIERIYQLSRNAQYFRKRLKQMGFVVCGNNDSPVVPMMLFMPAKIQGFVLKCLERGVATVGVGFPATNMTEERVRFCISAGHTKHMLDQALEVIDTVGDYVNCKYNKDIPSKKEIAY